MEAPEKIYLVNYDLNIRREWYKTKQIGFDTTEYTRTDAFIKKVCEWLATRYDKKGSLDPNDIEDLRKEMDE